MKTVKGPSDSPTAYTSVGTTTNASRSVNMTNATARPLVRPAGAKLVLRVYTVTREGIVTPPRATVTVPYGFEPARELLNTQLPPCACPLHRTAGPAR